MKGRVIYALYALLFLGVAVWLYQEWTSEERRLQRRLGEMRDLIEKNGGENDLIAANKARQLGELFTEDFAIHLLPINETVTDRQRLMQVSLQYRRQQSRIGLDFKDQQWTIEGRRAEVFTTATLSGTDDGGLSRDRFRLRLEWRSVEGVWSVAHLEVLEVLEGSPFGF